jgi:hypothetical protein
MRFLICTLCQALTVFEIEWCGMGGAFKRMGDVVNAKKIFEK